MCSQKLVLNDNEISEIKRVLALGLLKRDCTNISFNCYKHPYKLLKMTSYQTQLTLDESQQIVLSNLPFKEGTKLTINIEVIEEENPKSSSEFETLLDNTQGIWTKGDGLEYQQKIREEWS